MEMGLWPDSRLKYVSQPPLLLGAHSSHEDISALGCRGNKTEAFEAHLPLHCSSPSTDADDEFGNGVLQARRILGPESPKT